MKRETAAAQRVRLTLEFDGRVVVVENVPARVDAETGEQLFSPATVERLHEIVWSDRTPEGAIDFTAGT
jgi:hypothetical protein